MATRVYLLLFGFFLVFSSVAAAEPRIISVEEVKSLMTGKQKVIMIDARGVDEYQEGHIPGAINIPADRMKHDAARLPKDKSALLIFYCRGAG